MITSVQASMFLPMTTDPAPATSFAHLDANTVPGRVSELGIYPAVDPLDLVRLLDPLVVGEEHYQVARDVQSILQRYKSLQDIIANLEWMNSLRRIN